MHISNFYYSKIALILLKITCLYIVKGEKYDISQDTVLTGQLKTRGRRLDSWLLHKTTFG